MLYMLWTAGLDPMVPIAQIVSIWKQMRYFQSHPPSKHLLQHKRMRRLLFSRMVSEEALVAVGNGDMDHEAIRKPGADAKRNDVANGHTHLYSPLF